MKKNFPIIQLFVSVLLFCVFLFVFFYFFRAIKNNVEESKSKEGEWQTETLRRDEIKTLNNSIKVIEDKRNLLETHFAKSSDIVPFLDTIEELALKVNTKAEITSVNILEDHTGLSVGMKASGTFSGLYKFLTLLENSSYELDFISMNIQKGIESDTKNKIIPKWDAIFRIKLLSFIE